MKNAKLSVSVSVDGAQSSMEFELVPVDGDKFQPIVDLKLSNDFETTIKMPPSDYRRLRDKLEKLVKMTDIKTIEAFAKKVFEFLSL